MWVNILLIYFIPGLIWTLFFTGITVIKAVKWHRREQESLFSFLTIFSLAALFFVSWIGWPWSVYYNLPQMIREKRL